MGRQRPSSPRRSNCPVSTHCDNVMWFEMSIVSFHDAWWSKCQSQHNIATSTWLCQILWRHFEISAVSLRETAPHSLRRWRNAHWWRMIVGADYFWKDNNQRGRTNDWSVLECCHQTHSVTDSATKSFQGVYALRSNQKCSCASARGNTDRFYICKGVHVLSLILFADHILDVLF